MKILVIGSEGFIGSNAVKYFRDRGNTVFCADIFTKDEEKYTRVNQEKNDFTSLFLNRSYDACINASGAASVPFSFSSPAKDFTLNVSNVFNILDAIRQFNPSCRFINFSSAAVYGNPGSLPVTEDQPLKPISPYGWHKLQSEQVCREFYTFFNIPALSLRVFSAYGPGLKKQLFWDWYQKSKQYNPVEIYGTGNESRDFIYIDDLLRVVELVLEKAAFNGSVINVANGEELFIKELAELFFGLLAKEIKVTYSGHTKPGDPLNWRSDTRIIDSLGYRKMTTMESGLKKYTEWLSENGF